jgi:hypothetical protein
MRKLFKLFILFLINFICINASHKRPKANYEDVGIEILYKNRTKSPKNNNVVIVNKKNDTIEYVDEKKLYNTVFNQLTELDMGKLEFSII